jgi:hypothetical protein
LPEKTAILMQKSSRICDCYNIYAYFNQTHIWPRGFPLNTICQEYRESLTHNTVWIPIQQGLVNVDPDVDAIFRLTHKGNTIFASRQPVCLDNFVFCPFNSQNTIFYSSAFWALLLPITPSFRVCDIWRGYIMQRLLWDIGANLCFFAPTAEQYRNEHNLLKDFNDEIFMYQKTDALLNVLSTWRSGDPNLYNRLIELIETLINKDFLQSPDLELSKAWIYDLIAIGYQAPALS